MTTHHNTFFFKANKKNCTPQTKQHSTRFELTFEMELSYNFVNEGLLEFAGEDPFGWIIEVESFFMREKIHSTNNVQWAFMRMEGEAMLWFQS